MPTITINGAAYECAEDASVLDVALENDIWIPTLCHHPSLSEYGACRLCLVEMRKRGRTKVTVSCTLPASDGLEIQTESEVLTRQRRLVMELILASCPDAPAVLEMAQRLGARSDRLQAEAESDCIRCGLCVRACAEVSGAQAINFANRGVKRAVTTPFSAASDDCVLCGACVFVCPTESRLLDLAEISGSTPRQLRSQFDAQLAPAAAIHRPFPQALPNVPAIDCTACLHLNLNTCGVCERVCEAGAINFKEEDREEEIEVGAVILASGYDEFQPYEKREYGYSRFPDVLTSMEFERMLSASGPFHGHIIRPSDGREPKKIAFLQCVGSRDVPCRNGYCSSVCCMYAVKEAFIAKEHMDGLDTAVFFMDMRAFGKDFDKYYERAKQEQGVRFLRSRIHDIERNTNGELLLKYCPPGEGVKEEAFDLVVLSVGLEPTLESRNLARRLGINLNAFGFAWTDPVQPLRTSRPGVFAAGAATGPKDIPETVVQASAAACEAGRLLADVRDTLTTEATFPPEREVANAPPRVGVFVCHCGINIGGIVNVPDVATYAETLPHVVYSEDNLYTCSQDSQEHIRDMIHEQNLNRVVIASCSPRTHEPLFQETLKQAGLNANLIIMTNIRDQCSWAHMKQPRQATRKARDLVRMAVAKAVLAEPLQASTLPVTRTALVLGGGWAGLTAALAIADNGYHVDLVEREADLGGNLRSLHSGFEKQDFQLELQKILDAVEVHALIDTHRNTTVVEVTGFVGNFSSKLSDGSEIKHGAVVVATGAAEYTPREYEYGMDSRIVTQKQLCDRLASIGANPAALPEHVVMIQCVGSRNDEHPYCSRICCARAVSNAIQIKDLRPDTEVYVLYRDMRTYGMRETLYQRARELGVNFIQFELGQEPQIHLNGTLSVSVRDPVLNETLALHTDLLVLSTGVVAASDDNDTIGKLFKVPVNEDGFFLEAHAKLRPVEFATEGVFLAGLAHGPKAFDESTAQALAAASRACTILQKKEIQAQATTAWVRPEKCVACGLCEDVCAYGAATLELQQIGREQRVFANVNPALCKGCGACVAGCRGGALNLRGFTDQQVLAEILNL